ncbi:MULTISPECIES: hypothetical protein [unclassified Bradyrhizobium]|nr:MULTISPECIES: hypothetical protein [unclassified Bradyrhizobium]
MPNDVDGRDKPGHDGVETDERNTSIIKCDSPAAGGERLAASVALDRPDN